MIPIDVLHTIYEEAAAKGGIVEVSSIGAFPAVMRSGLVSAQPDLISEDITPQLVERVRQLLFSI